MTTTCMIVYYSNDVDMYCVYVWILDVYMTLYLPFSDTQ